jgi:hypothetical protein
MNRLLLLLILVLALAVSACSGNRAIVTTGTGLDGQLVQGSNKVTTAAGDGLTGVNVELIATGNGQVASSTVTTADGRFSFRELPNGQFLLKLSFRSSADLDGDGVLDLIESFIPITLSQDVIDEITAALDFDDTDADSTNDALKIDIRIRAGANGPERHFIRWHRHRHGDTQVDENGDGSVDDDFDDEDQNGLPDDGSHHGGNFPQGPKLRGTIEAISASSITVSGETFTITDATEFKVRGDSGGDSSQFTVGDEVQVTSFTDSDGNNVALEIKLKHGHANHDNDDNRELTFRGTLDAISATSLTLSGLEFELGARTHFFLLGHLPAVQTQLHAGDYVQVEAQRLADGSLLVLRVEIEPVDDPDESCLEVVGVISALSETSVTINGLSLAVNGDTEFTLKGGAAGTAADFAVGDRIQICANLIGDQWVAAEFEQEVEGNAIGGHGHGHGGDDDN